MNHIILFTRILAAVEHVRPGAAYRDVAPEVQRIIAISALAGATPEGIVTLPTCQVVVLVVTGQLVVVLGPGDVGESGDINLIAVIVRR